MMVSDLNVCLDCFYGVIECIIHLSSLLFSFVEFESESEEEVEEIPLIATENGTCCIYTEISA